MPLILALGRQRQADLCEFKANLIYKVSSRTAGTVDQKKSYLEKPIYKYNGLEKL